VADRIHAFVDECGDPSLYIEKGGVSQWFVMAAVLVHDDDLTETRDKTSALLKKHAGSGELKSSNIGNNDARRLTILHETQDIPYCFYGLVIHKRRIRRDGGLAYKRSFYKYLNKMLYEHVGRSARTLSVLADEHGGKEFISSFEDYMESQIPPDLFFQRSVKMVDSKSDKMLQLADVIAGSIARVCAAPESNSSKDIWKVLTEKSAGVSSWPTGFTFVNTSQHAPLREEDLKLRALNIANANRFIKEHEESPDDSRKMQVAVLRLLMFSNVFDGRVEPLLTGALRRSLQVMGFQPGASNRFSAEVIGPLRDAAVLITGDRNGYRLALSIDDLMHYVIHVRNVAEPMLRRLSEARGLVRLETGLDILASGPYQSVRRIVEAYSIASISDDAF